MHNEGRGQTSSAPISVVTVATKTRRVSPLNACKARDDQLNCLVMVTFLLH